MFGIFNQIGLLGILATTTVVAGQSQYSVTDLGSQVRYDRRFSAGINSSGQVAWTGKSSEHGHAYLWDGTTNVDLGKFPLGTDESGVYSINGNGDVVGYSNADLYPRAFLWTQSGGMKALNAFPGSYGGSAAIGINSTGEIVGWGYTSAGVVHAALWRNGNIQDLGDLPGGMEDSIAMAINSTAQVVGYSYGSYGKRAVRWTEDRGMQELFDLPFGYHSWATGINDAGDIIGGTGRGGNDIAFLWTQRDGMQSLGTLPGGQYSIAWGMNSSCTVVGMSNGPVAGAFIWDATHGMRNLNDLVDSTGIGWELIDAQAINDGGEIVCTGIDTASSEPHEFLLTPIPEPECAFVEAVFFFTLFAIRRRAF